jgi:hypothetical protein
MQIELLNYDDKNKELSINGIFYHDINGNLYLEINNKYYVLIISLNDEIEFIEINDYNNLVDVDVDNTINYSQIKNTYEKNSLKGKINNELEENENDDDDDDYINDTDEYYKNKYKAFPEDKLYTVDKNEDDDDDYNIYDNIIDDTYQAHYVFSKYGSNSTIECLKKTLDCLANYDTFIINYNTSYVLATIESTIKSEYRISIYTCGKISLNIVGSKIKMYNIFYTIVDGVYYVHSNRIHTKLIN